MAASQKNLSSAWLMQTKNSTMISRWVLVVKQTDASFLSATSTGKFKIRSSKNSKPILEKLPKLSKSLETKLVWICKRPSWRSKLTSSQSPCLTWTLLTQSWKIMVAMLPVLTSAPLLKLSSKELVIHATALKESTSPTLFKLTSRETSTSLLSSQTTRTTFWTSFSQTWLMPSLLQPQLQLQLQHQQLTHPTPGSSLALVLLPLVSASSACPKKRRLNLKTQWKFDQLNCSIS